MLKLDKSRFSLENIKSTSKSTFDKSWTTGKKGFDKGWKALDKLGTPINGLSNKLGAEAFWPMTLDKEAEKAARILKAFLSPAEGDTSDTTREGVPQGKQRVIKHIPPSVIANAKAIAVFTACRTGFWVSSAGGAGVLIRRLQPDDPPARFDSIDLNRDDKPPAYTPTNAGCRFVEEIPTPPQSPELDPFKSSHWSPPSGILLHTAALGFLVGADIYDCVMVLNTDAAVEAFTNPRLTLGAEVSVAAGPYSLGGVFDQNIGGGVRHLNQMRKNRKATSAANKKEGESDQVVLMEDQQARGEGGSGVKQGEPENKDTRTAWEKMKDERPIWSYLKSRGLYVGLGQLDGSIVIERTDENARFYGVEGVKVRQILSGGVSVPPVSYTGEENGSIGVHALWDVLDAVVELADAESAAAETSSTTSSMNAGLQTAYAKFRGMVGNVGTKKAQAQAPVVDDPFGIRALEQSGVTIVEAGSHKRVASDEFDEMFPPSPRTPTTPQSAPPVPKRGGSLRTVNGGTWLKKPDSTTDSPLPADRETNAECDELYVNVSLRNEEAIKRAEEEIKEWEKQREEERKKTEERRDRMKRWSDDGLLERSETGETLFDYGEEKKKENRRSTYS